MTDNQKLAILVGGGPAPGINSVIGAATIHACAAGTSVLGVQDGFKWLMQGDRSHVVPLTIEATSRVHFRGGSMLGISRANPTKKPESMAKVLATLKELGVGKLITIGGDDTCFSSSQLAKASQGSLRVVHVPKTIDNDLDLPHYVDTFGFQTARHIGAQIVENLMVDAKTTSRWYFVVAMGRKAGHLALGIGKAASATLTLVSEEFESPLPLATIVDTLTAAILKRHAQGRQDGVAVLAEGLVEQIDPKDIEGLDGAERDEHGHIRIAEVDIGAILKNAVRKKLKELGIDTTIATKNVGYELRCADPIPLDMEYTRDLGHSASRYLLEGGTEALVSIQRGAFEPVPFAKIMHPVSGRMKVRMVDVTSDRYRIARQYMLRLDAADLADAAKLKALADAAKLTPEAFTQRFGYLVRDAKAATPTS